MGIAAEQPSPSLHCLQQQPHTGKYRTPNKDSMLGTVSANVGSWWGLQQKSCPSAACNSHHMKAPVIQGDSHLRMGDANSDLTTRSL
eukprot:1159502-Pelagomonas_calceolata.AAC.9